MRYLVLSDIHANLEALEATLLAAVRYDSVLLLGDVVGYGADPNAVIDRVRELPVEAMIRGNHDKVAAGIESAGSFNMTARDAIRWTSTILTAENRAWLAALPAGPLQVDDVLEICHGTPFDEDAYVFDDVDALRALRAAQRPLCLYGHTHVPAVFRLEDRTTKQHGEPVRGGSALELIGPVRSPVFDFDLERAVRYLVNCGAVGQPRDGDPRAAYGIVDTGARTATLARVEYDVRTAQAKVRQAGLPDTLAQRLAVGR